MTGVNRVVGHGQAANPTPLMVDSAPAASIGDWLRSRRPPSRSRARAAFADRLGADVMVHGFRGSSFGKAHSLHYRFQNLGVGTRVTPKR
jgi:hypothetical protein